ncbi:MAG TPA: TlpA disulfide reductase family protein [Bryobacteraceae bacterium]|nr:TlpA disulfide reductase family protein [Bryobacteraceae bacterium]
MKTDRVNKILEAGIVVMLLAFVGTLYMSLHETVVTVGDTAPNFSIQTDTGKTITARDFGGKLLILNFWATWCPPCIHEVPSLNQLQSILGPKGLVVLGVSEDKDPQAYKDFINRFHVTYQTARAPDQEIKSKYGTVQIPESYLIDQNGKVVEKIVSETNWSSEQMVQHVQSLL